VRLLLAFILGFVLLSTGGGTALAADSLRMTVRPGFDGVAKLGAWFPIEVRVANAGDEVTGEVQVTIEGIENRGSFNRPPVLYTVPVSLPRQSNKRYVVDIFLPAPVDRLAVKLVEGETLLAATEAPIAIVNQTEIMCGFIGANRASLDFLPAIELPGRQKGIRLAHLDPLDLPASPQLLATLDCLILANAPLSSLGEAQRSALAGWVSSGGTLVVAGGPGWQRTIGGLPPGLLPARVNGTVPLRTTKALEAFARAPIEDAGPWVAAEAQVTDGVVILSENNVPLLIAAERGRGSVFFLALDPALEPLRSWRGSVHLWKYIAGYAAGQPQLPSNFIRQYAGWGRMPRLTLSDLSPLPAPNAPWMPYLLVAYAVVVGPVTYLALRRLGRLEWALWCVPLVTVATATAAFFGAGRSGEAEILFNKVALVQGRGTHGEAYTRTYVAAFAPRDGTHTIEILAEEGLTSSADRLVWPVFYPFPVATGTPTAMPLKVERGAGTRILEYSLPARSLGTFQVDAPSRATAAFDAKLLSDGQMVYGTITNGSKSRLTSASLVVGDEVVPLGDLQGGETRNISLRVGQGSRFSGPDMNSIVRRLYPHPADATPVSNAEMASRDILENVLNTGQAFATRVEFGPVSLVGWSGTPPVRLRTERGREAEIDRTLIVTSFPIAAAPGEAQRVPSQLVERRNLIAGSGRITASGISMTSGESILFEYRLPHRPDRFRIDDLAMVVSGSSTDRVPMETSVSASIYDWPGAEWKEVQIFPGKVALGSPDRVVSALGTMRLRMTYRAMQGATTTLTFDSLELMMSGRGV